MKIFIITIVVVIVLIIIYITCPNLHLTNNIIPFYKRKDNIFPVIKDDFEELNIFCSSGLSNRIRTILGFKAVCDKFNKKLNVIWIPDNACNGNFTDYFKDINNVNFFKKKIEPVHYLGQSSIKNILNHYKIEKKEYELYSNIKLKKHIENKVIDFINNNDIKNCVGIHVRRTDYTGNFIGKLLNGSNDDSEFFNYIDKYSKGCPFFIATDNKETQTIFKNKYGNRALFYSKIKDIKNLRKTSLEDAIIDIFILSNCLKIKGTYNSSFTDFSKNLKKKYFFKLKCQIMDLKYSI
jgi:hypothetical protein